MECTTANSRVRSFSRVQALGRTGTPPRLDVGLPGMERHPRATLGLPRYTQEPLGWIPNTHPTRPADRDPQQGPSGTGSRPEAKPGTAGAALCPPRQDPGPRDPPHPGAGGRRVCRARAERLGQNTALPALFLVLGSDASSPRGRESRPGRPQRQPLFFSPRPHVPQAAAHT